MSASAGPLHRMRWRLWLGVAAGLVIVVVAVGLAVLKPQPGIATGYVSRTLCSGVFVSGLGPGQVYEQMLKPLPGLKDIAGILRYEVARDRREVTASLGGFFERRAVFVEGRGCTLLPGNDPGSARLTAIPTAERTAPVLPGIAGAAAVAPGNEQLREAVDRAFEESTPSPRRTAAVVVMHDGRVVAERYAPGYGVDTPLLGYSVTKSVMNALLGILVRQGRLSVDAPAPVAQWRDPADPRHAITIDMLVRMTSGLDVPETNSGLDAVSRMLMLESDMAGFAERAGLAAIPGKTWAYTSGNTLIVSRIVRDAVGRSPGDVLAFARRELFDPLGMRTVTLEFDPAGTPIGSTYMYASARDWVRFGMLYLEDGVAGVRRILPEGWVRYSSSQTLDSPYAAGFWRYSAGLRKNWGLPEDAFFGSGFLGQRLLIIPSERLVIARFGNSHDPTFDLRGFGQLVKDVRAALAARK